jgi:predicted DNA-binding transcriptional regulator AlpA
MNVQVNADRLLLRVPEVADCLSVSRALAYRWLRDGVLPTVAG